MCQINTVTAKTQFGYLHVVGKFYTIVLCVTNVGYQYGGIRNYYSIEFLGIHITSKHFGTLCEIIYTKYKYIGTFMPNNKLK